MAFKNICMSGILLHIIEILHIASLIFSENEKDGFNETAQPYLEEIGLLGFLKTDYAYPQLIESSSIVLPQLSYSLRNA